MVIYIWAGECTGWSSKCYHCVPSSLGFSAFCCWQSSLWAQGPLLWHRCLAKMWLFTEHCSTQSSSMLSCLKARHKSFQTSYRSSVPPTRKALKSTSQWHALPCVPPASSFAPGTVAAPLYPSDWHSRQVPVAAAAAGSWATTRKCTSACSCSGWAACLK